MKRAKILLQQEDLSLGLLLRDFLILNNYEVIYYNNKIDLLLALKKNDFNLIILDETSSASNFYDKLREVNKFLPVLFFKEKKSGFNNVENEEFNVNYYIHKPFSPSFLLDKIKEILVKDEYILTRKNNLVEFIIGDFSFNSKQRYLTFKDQESKKLSPKENKLLKTLILNKNELTPRGLLLRKIWYDDNYYTSRSMDVYIAKLRKYLKSDKNINILTIHGKGLKLVC